MVNQKLKQYHDVSFTTVAAATAEIIIRRHKTTALKQITNVCIVGNSINCKSTSIEYIILYIILYSM